MTEIERASLAYIESFYKFYRYFAWSHISQDTFVDNWHIREICNELHRYRDAIVKREHIPDLIVNIPPGSSKSSIISQSFPVWLWLFDPSINVIVSSYSGGLSTDHSIKAKQIIQNPEFDIFFANYFKIRHGKELRILKDNEGHWNNNFGGQYVVTSTGGTVIGRHAHLIIRDDPISPEQTHSDAYRSRAHRFNDQTLATRKKNKDATPTITVMQRLHEDDITGHELAKNRTINHINLPAEYSEKITPERFKKLYINGLLDVNRMSRNVLDDQRELLGSYGYSGQYLQEPYPEDGGRVKREWFTFIEDIPKLPYDIWIDGAYTDKTSNDPTGIMEAAHDIANNRIVIKSFVSKYMELPMLLKYIETMKYNAATMCYIEPKASGLSIIQMLKERTFINVTRIAGKLVGAGKEARINTSSPRIESGRVVLVRGGWNDEFIRQHTGFPNVTHDEAVDLLGYACQKYF